MSYSTLRIRVLCFPILAALACGSEIPDHADPSRLAERVLDPDPLAVIGGTDDRPGYAIGRSGPAILLEDRLVVVDRLALEVRFYTLSGEIVRVRGGAP